MIHKHWQIGLSQGLKKGGPAGTALHLPRANFGGFEISVQWIEPADV